MQLILVDTVVGGHMRPCNTSLDFIMQHDDIHRSLMAYKQAQNANDEETRERKKIVTEIMIEDPKLRLMITLWLWSHNQTLEITVVPCNPDESIFKSLVQKFQEDVKISVCFKGRGGVSLASVEGMTINQDFACKGTTTNIDSSDLGNFQLCRIEIVADVIADTIVAPKRVPFAQKVLEKESFSNVVIVAANGAEIKAHKSFLSVCSPVLKAMFASKMEEPQTGRVDMSDLSEEGVRAFLRYIYHEDLVEPEENIQVAYELFYASHKYLVPGLEAEMKMIFLKTEDKDISVSLALKMYMFTKNIEFAVELKIKALRILKAKWDELELLQEYQDMFEPEESSYSKESLLELCRDLATTTTSSS